MSLVKNIACIGNMNNMMSPIALYLRDAGYNVTLFLLNEYNHFHPQADTDEQIQLEIIQLGWEEKNFSDISSTTIQNTFKNYHFFIGTDYAAAFCNKANIQLDIYFPAGTDLSEWPFKQSKRFIPHRWEFNITLCSKAQFYGIKQAKYLAIDPTNKEYEELIIKIRGNANHTENIPYHYLPFFQKNIDLPKELNQFIDAINQFDFKILYHGRQEWTMGDESVHYKGNERLFEGFKMFSLSTNSKAVLILLEYGSDVEASKNLIKKLGIENNVIWLPKMLRKQLFQFIKKANVGIGMFGKGWYSSCSIYEIMMAAKPLITYYEPKNTQMDIYPYLNANNAKDIFDALIKLYSNTSDSDNLGEATFKWLIKKNNLRVENIIEKIKIKNYKKNIINQVKFYPYYQIYYKIKMPISWLNEFISVRILNSKIK